MRTIIPNLPAYRGKLPPTDRVEPSLGHVPAIDDAGDAGKTLAEENIPGPIGVDVPGTIRPPSADRAPTIPTLGVCRWKCLRIFAKRSNQGHCADQVITQIELPPYHEPRSPLDLVALEIVFNCIFEAFCPM
jgi:hypothetical protein